MVRNVNWEDEVRMDIGDAADNVTESLTRGDDMKSVLKTLELLKNGAKLFFNKEEIAYENLINEIVKKYRAQKKENKIQKKENEDVSDNEDTKNMEYSILKYFDRQHPKQTPFARTLPQPQQPPQPTPDEMDDQYSEEQAQRQSSEQQAEFALDAGTIEKQQIIIISRKQTKILFEIVD
ncbi:MAG: hypothetical protein EZS28_039286 [Streblomastix strix]|uniref:Uncharacterized protein n=1 Tax=Streblomastix strix TaxID=222440 RepID=A0A5J4U3L8_9EUKA|nr:MAG: hypothetical protein EZS28_039286 [Streblomastix strix]